MRCENQSGMCGKSVGNDLKYWKTLLLRTLLSFSPIFLRPQSYEFDVIVHAGAPLGV